MDNTLNNSKIQNQIINTKYKTMLKLLLERTKAKNN